jgi:hypothetical protein
MNADRERTLELMDAYFRAANYPGCLPKVPSASELLYRSGTRIPSRRLIVETKTQASPWNLGQTSRNTTRWTGILIHRV